MLANPPGNLVHDTHQPQPGSELILKVEKPIKRFQNQREISPFIISINSLWKD